MKKIIFYLAAFLFFTSCTSVESLVERGQYEEAFEFAVRKLAGKKNKKTDHVQGLEEAFEKMKERDLEIASRLIDQNLASNWVELHDIYNELDYRQNLVKPLLPLVSKDGYKANFTFVRVGKLINEAALNAAAFEYERGLSLLERGKYGDKEAAKVAYYTFGGIHTYIPDYKDINDLQDEAEYLGQTRVLVEVKNRNAIFFPNGFNKRILSMSTHDLNDKWTKYYFDGVPNMEIDYKATLMLNDLDVSPEREFVKVHVNEKRIKDGEKFKLDKRGNVKLDSLGKPIKVASFKKVRAKVTEIRRTKTAAVSGVIHIVNLETGERYKSERINTIVDFSDISCSFRGDKRALESKWNTHFGGSIAPFPSDRRMIMDAADDLKLIFKKRLKQNIY